MNPQNMQVLLQIPSTIMHNYFQGKKEYLDFHYFPPNLHHTNAQEYESNEAPDAHLISLIKWEIKWHLRHSFHALAP